MQLKSSDQEHHIHDVCYKLMTLAILLIALNSAFIPVNCRVISVPRDFSNIQSAINASAPGDTIFIDKMNFTENIIITKPLRLRGEDDGKRRTVISSDCIGCNIITLESGNVILERLAVLNNGSSNTGIYIESNDNVIENISVLGPYYKGHGIILKGCQNNTIANCSIYENRRGVLLDNCFLARICDNKFSENWIGLDIGSNSTNNNIYNNLFESNEFAISYWHWSSLSDNPIKNITFINNKHDMIASRGFSLQ